MDDRTARVLCDWGGTRLRASLEVAGEIVQRCEGPGIGALRGRPCAQVLLSAIAPWRRDYRITGAFLSGMAGSRDGLTDVPYVGAPVTAAIWARAHRKICLDDLTLTIAAGVRACNFRRVADVMRGEEAQVFGALALNPRLAAGRRLFLLPGTHSKWVEVEAGEIIRLQTYLTGELFSLLCESSSLLRAATRTEAADDGFEAGLERAGQCDVPAALFEARSAQLVAGKTGGWAKAFISGLLVGGEARSILTSGAFVPDPPVTVIGESALAARYLRALAAHGVSAEVLDGESCALQGLRVLAATAEEMEG
ncbi:MAG TPA: 2-dehydro-3-deoxygalactonokinase [Steroidobacteraceae bacterium]|nr:2-dehydro-3-deoxygalactonokinase [Steroidobacteraceae bacterium]